MDTHTTRAIQGNPLPAPFLNPQEIAVQYCAVECSWTHFSTPGLSRISPPGNSVKHGIQPQCRLTLPRPCHASPPTHTPHHTVLPHVERVTSTIWAFQSRWHRSGDQITCGVRAQQPRPPEAARRDD